MFIRLDRLLFEFHTSVLEQLPCQPGIYATDWNSRVSLASTLLTGTITLYRGPQLPTYRKEPIFLLLSSLSSLSTKYPVNQIQTNVNTPYGVSN
jgi:hypothetical protein